MSLEATSAVFQARGLSPVQRLVLLVYADHCGEDGQCWPSQARVAERAEISRQSVNRATKDLEKLGLISLKHRAREGGGQTSSVVTINIERCKETRQGVSQNVTGGETYVDRGVKHSATGGETQGDTNLPLESPRRNQDPPNPPEGGTRKRASFDPLGLELPHGEPFKRAWALWCRHRKELGGKYQLKPTSTSQQLKKLGSMSESHAIATIENTVANSWVGLREPELPKTANGRPQPLTKAVDAPKKEFTPKELDAMLDKALEEKRAANGK